MPTSAAFAFASASAFCSASASASSASASILACLAARARCSGFIFFGASSAFIARTRSDTPLVMDPPVPPEPFALRDPGRRLAAAAARAPRDAADVDAATVKCDIVERPIRVC